MMAPYNLKMCLIVHLLYTPHIDGILPILRYQYSLMIRKSFSCLSPRSLNIQHVVEVGDVTNSESQDLDLGQLLVWWERWQQFPQLFECHIEGHHADALPGGVRGSISSRRAPPSPLFLPAENGHVHVGRDWHGATLLCESVQEGLRALLSPGQVGPGLVGTEHHAPVPERTWRRNTSNLELTATSWGKYSAKHLFISVHIAAFKWG